MGLMAKIKGMLGKNPDKAKAGVDKAGDAADSKTKGQYSDKIDTGADKAKDEIDKLPET